MSTKPYIKELLSMAYHLAESLSERIPRSTSLQRGCKDLARNLDAWRKKLLADTDFLLKPTGDKTLYKAILSPLSELLCILCQLTWTAHEFSKPLSLNTARADAAEQKIAAAAPAVKKSQTALGVWQRPRKGHAPLAVLFDPAARRSDGRFVAVEDAVTKFVEACCGGLLEAGGKVKRARGRHVGLRLLGGKEI